jgi:hypothetical protein
VVTPISYSVNSSSSSINTDPMTFLLTGSILIFILVRAMNENSCAQQWFKWTAIYYILYKIRYMQYWYVFMYFWMSWVTHITQIGGIIAAHEACIRWKANFMGLGWSWIHSMKTFEETSFWSKISISSLVESGITTCGEVSDKFWLFVPQGLWHYGDLSAYSSAKIFRHKDFDLALQKRCTHTGLSK